MQIAIVHPYPAPAGREKATSQIIDRDLLLGSILEELGHTVRGFRTTRSSSHLAVEVTGRPTWEHYAVDNPKAAGSQVTCSALVQALGQWGPDVVIVKGAGTKLGDQLLRRHERGPFVIIIGGNYTAQSLYQCEVILTETLEQEQYLSRRVSSSRLVRLPKYANEIFTPNERAQKAFDIAVVSKFEQHKNHSALLPLMEQDVSIVFVGDGSLKKTFEGEAAKRAAQSTFTGNLDPDGVASVLQQSRLLVHPSTSEGFPRAVVEAMATGLPVVGLKGVIGWPVIDGVSGRIVDSEEIHETVMQLIGDRDRLESYSINALSTAKDHFSRSNLEKAANQLVEQLKLSPRTMSRVLIARNLRRTRGSLVDLPRATLRRGKKMAYPVARAVGLR